ncbi:unnamed protein product [Psylliodes chrysocephalus]|uniref:Uncharacterized protein n=1 Tax=Psylliodes chrysocephalus TaxID=3402493 RepID=A0A9P0D280_9CUCU|nr:unnamed protein product [Psylliodes chrysocephala]
MKLQKIRPKDERRAELLNSKTSLKSKNRDSVTLKKKGHSRKQREFAKILRNTGKEYVNEKGETKPRKDTCYKCDTLKIQITYASEEEKERLIFEQANHHSAADEAYKAKPNDKIIARVYPSTAVFAFDLQQCLPTPYLQSSISFYKRQLWTYNLTVLNLATNEATCYIWNESVSGRGGNQIASCLYRHIIDLPSNVKKSVFIQILAEVRIKIVTWQLCLCRF